MAPNAGFDALLGGFMESGNHLCKAERSTIETMLGAGSSLSSIADKLDRNKSTISREIRRNSSYRRSGANGRRFNNCANRFGCTVRGLCEEECGLDRDGCAGCATCFRTCADFVRQTCPLPLRPPYACNGCASRRGCTLEKFVYSARDAQASYERELRSSREGLALPDDEIARIDAIITPLLLNGQSIHAVMAAHKDEIMVDEKTIYAYVKAGVFGAKILDMPRMVRMKPRKRRPKAKIERGRREGRRLADLHAFLEENPDTPVVQLDSVIGAKGEGEPVLLTVHFTESSLMLAFRREANTARSVTEIFDRLDETLGREAFTRLFPVCLADNGSEFSNPSAIEFDSKGVRRTRVFYADPRAPYQRAACENNHSLLRRIFPKGKSFKPFAQADIDLAINNLNSYARKRLGDRTPMEFFEFLHGSDVVKKIGLVALPRDEVIISTILFRK